MDDYLEQRLVHSQEVSNNTTDAIDLKSSIWAETKTIWRIAVPGMIANMTQFLLIVVTQLFLGHVSELDLAAYAIEQNVFLRFVNGILIGMSSATETLCGQAFGAKQYHMMGVYLQRSWIVDGVTATILVPLFIFTTPILRLIGQYEDISIEAGTISLWFIPFLYYFVFSLTTQMYLQAQMKNKILGWFCVPSLFLHVALSWLLVMKLDLGVAGAMTSLNVCGWLVVIAEFVYVFGGWCRDTWKGFTKAAFTDIWPVVKLSISAGVMLCLDMWYLSILVLLAGYIENATVAISAFSICLNVTNWHITICLGFLGAASIRVSNELGSGNANAAKFSIKVNIGTSVCIGLFFSILCLVFGRQISYFFSSSEEIADVVSSLSGLLALSVFLNSIQGVLIGVTIGAGLQGWIAIVNLGSYYLIGVPLGAVLGYVANLGVTGLWIGLLSGIITQTSILAFIIWRIDWDNQVSQASKRLGRWFLESEESNNRRNFSHA